MKAFQPVADELFVKRLAAQLREKHAQAAVLLPSSITTVKKLPEETLLELVRNAVARAREYGFRTESGLAAFVVIMFEAAPNFDAHPLIRRVLKDAETTPDARLERILEETSEENWEAVKQNYDAGAWGLK